MRQVPKRETFEQVHGAGPVGGTRPLNENGGRIPTRRVIERATGNIVLVNADEPCDETLYDELPGGAP